MSEYYTLPSFRLTKERIRREMKDFKNRLAKLKSEVPDSVTIVAVSKTKPISMLEEAYEAGQRVFGENKVQEVLLKQPQLPDDIEWHMIGHLQTNKVKQVVPFVSMIHAVDSLKLLNKIQSEAAKIDRVIPCLIQVHIATEETKFGFDLLEADTLFNSISLSEYPNIVFSGLMGMASYVEDDDQVKREFGELKILFDEIKSGPMSEYGNFKEISIGMTGDYHLAVEKGSTMIRVGTLLFGSR